jgi:ATP-dependent DNA helicase DinG
VSVALAQSVKVESTEDLAVEILAEAVKLAANATPRPQQVSLTKSIIEHAQNHGRLGASAPTGVGKSLSYLSALAALSINEGQKSVVSTETKQLQSQIIHKDLPTVIEACRNVRGRAPKGAVLKGRQNYLCHVGLASYMSLPDDHRMSNSELARLAGKDQSDLVNVWLSQKLGDNAWDGSVDDLPSGEGVDRDIASRLTTGSSGCLGDDCPFRAAERCFADSAIAAAEESDIAVTNHTMLAIELTKKIPVAYARAERDPRILVIDEAHSLEGVVRGQEADHINPALASSVAKQIGTVGGAPLSKPVARVVEKGKELEQMLAMAADLTVDAKSYHKTNAVLHKRLDNGILSFADALDNLRSKADLKTRGVQGLEMLNRLNEHIGNLQEMLDVTENKRTAMWIEPDGYHGHTLVMQSIQVSTHLARAIDAMTGDSEESEAEDEHHSTVVAMSATLPRIVASNITGRGATYLTYRSPFEVAFGSSALYLPTDPDSMAPNKRFELNRHTEWATQTIVDLVSANDGSALVLAASAASAETYYLALEQQVGKELPIIFYRDGSSRIVVERWKRKSRAVLVATRGMMTGVDAPGETCTLVVIDRVPRAYPTLTHELRVEAFTTPKVERYLAEARVYGGDAATLLEQAVGRLIRSETDHGMVAILDPRLNPDSPCHYKPPYSTMYSVFVNQFGAVLDSKQDALEYVESQSTAER